MINKSKNSELLYQVEEEEEDEEVTVLLLQAVVPQHRPPEEGESEADVEESACERDCVDRDRAGD